MIEATVKEGGSLTSVMWIVAVSTAVLKAVEPPVAATSTFCPAIAWSVPSQAR